MPATMLNEKTRRILYTIFAIIGAAFTATFASYGAIPGEPAPDWLIRAFAGFSALTAAFGAVAANNTGDKKDDAAEDDSPPPQHADLDENEPGELPDASDEVKLS